jgi:hypothetical protein
MLSRFKESEIGKSIIGNDLDFVEIMLNDIKRYNYKVIEKDLKEYEIDKILGKQIINHLQVFFNKNKQKTMNKRSLRNKTRKRLF